MRIGPRLGLGFGERGGVLRRSQLSVARRGVPLLIAFVTCTVLGAALASFVGVLLDRLPRGESIITPASHCGACGTFLAPFDNLPVISWIVLRGRCRHCSAFIPLQFFVLEVLGAAAGATIALTLVH